MKSQARLLVLLLILLTPASLNANNAQWDRQCGFGCDHAFSGERGLMTQIKQFFGSMFSTEQFNRSYAVVVGISAFDEYNTLPTKNDPIRVKNFLIKSGFDSVHVLTGKHVSQAHLGRIMDNMRRKIGANDRFLFYWQGHGETITGNNREVGFLPLANSKRGRINTMLSMRQLVEWDDLLRAKQTLYLLDACFSGLAGTAVMSNELTDLTIQDLAKKGRHLLTAGAANQLTFADAKLKGSVFTTALLDGLGGKADTASEYGKDGVISLGELDLYLRQRINYERTRFRWTKPLTPQLTRLSTETGSFFFLTPEYKKLSTIGLRIKRDDGDAKTQSMSGNRTQTELQAGNIGKNKHLARIKKTLMQHHDHLLVRMMTLQNKCNFFKEKYLRELARLNPNSGNKNTNDFFARRQYMLHVLCSLDFYNESSVTGAMAGIYDARRRNDISEYHYQKMMQILAR